jgi:hypothetical protein
MPFCGVQRIRTRNTAPLTFRVTHCVPIHPQQVSSIRDDALSEFKLCDRVSSGPLPVQQKNCVVSLRNILCDFHFYTGTKEQKRTVTKLRNLRPVRDGTTWMPYDEWLRTPHDATQGGQPLTWQFDGTSQTVIGPFTRNNDDTPVSVHVADHDALGEAMRAVPSAVRTTQPITTFHSLCFHVAEGVFRRLVPRPVVPNDICAAGLFWFKVLRIGRASLKALLGPTGPEPQFLEQLRATHLPFPIVSDMDAHVPLFAPLDASVSPLEAFELLRLLVACLHEDELEVSQCNGRLLAEFAATTPVWTHGAWQNGYQRSVPLGQWAVRPNVARRIMEDDRRVKQGKPKRRRRQHESDDDDDTGMGS